MMQPLITAGDMTARNITVDRYSDVSLAVASAAVREAAGVPISVLTATVDVPGSWGCYLDMPSPLTDATAVMIDGAAVADYIVWPAYLYRANGWGSPAAKVTATITTGTTVPDDIIQLVCELAVLISAAEAVDPRAASESIDDYSITYRGDGTVSAVELPEATRRSLQARFSGSPVVGSR